MVQLMEGERPGFGKPKEEEKKNLGATPVQTPPQDITAPVSAAKEVMPPVEDQLGMILRSAVERGELPPKMKVMEGIRSGKYTIDEAKEAWKIKKSQAQTAEAKDKMSTLDTIKAVGSVVESAAEKAFGFSPFLGVTTVGKDGELNKVKDIYASTVSEIKEDKPIFKTPEYKSMKETGSLTKSTSQYFLDALNNEFEKQTFIAKKLASGLSMNIYDPDEDEAPDKTTAVAGAAAELLGFGVSTHYLLKGLKKVPVVGPGLSKLGDKAKGASTAVAEAKAAGEAVGFGAKAAKHGLQVASIVAESAPLGFASGAAKGVVEGDDFNGIITKGLQGLALFAVGGAALYPAIGAVAAGVKKGVSWGMGRFMYGPRAKALGKQAEDMVAENPGYYVDMLESMEQTEGVKEALRYAKAAQKVWSSGIEGGPFPIADKIKTPEALEALFKGRQDDLKFMAENMFKGTPLEILAAESSGMKALIDKGEYARALMAGQIFFNEQLKKNKPLREWISAPFMNDATFLKEAMSERLLGGIDNVENPVAAFNLLNNYQTKLLAGTATKADLKAVRDTIAGSDKATRKRFGLLANKEKFLDVRPTLEEADGIVGKALNARLEYLSNAAAKTRKARATAGARDKYEMGTPVEAQSSYDYGTPFGSERKGYFAGTPNGRVEGKISGAVKESFGKPKENIRTPFGTIESLTDEALDTQSMLKTAIHANRQFTNGLIQAANRHRQAMDFDNMYVVVDPEMVGEVGKKAGLLDEMHVRINVEMLSHETKRLKELRGLLKSKQLKLVPEKNIPAKDSGVVRSEAEALSDNIFSTRARISELYKKINTSKGALDALDPETAARIAQAANEIHQPSLKDIGAKKVDEYGLSELKGAAASDILKRFQFKDSNVFLKSESEMVDMIGALNYTGTDISDSFHSAVKKQAAFLNIDNFRRLAQREFGYGNPMENLLGQMKQAELKINGYKQAVLDELKTIGIKKGTKESDLLALFAEDRLTIDSPEFLKLKPDLQAKLIDGKAKAEGILKRTIGDINHTNAAHNLPLVNERKNYFPHMRQILEDMPEMIKQLVTHGRTEQLQKAYNIRQHPNDPTKTFFGHEMPRRLDRPPTDAIGSIERYINSAAERIFYTPFMRAVDTAKVMSTGKNMQNFFQLLKDNVLARKFSDEAMDIGAQELATFGIRRLAKGALMGSVNFLAQQAASIPLSLMIGGKEAVYATVNRFSKEMAEISKLSVNAKARHRIDYSELDGRLFGETTVSAEKLLGKRASGVLKSINQSKPGQMAQKASDFWEKATAWAANVFDQEAADHAFRTGVYYGKMRGVTDQKALAYLGDHFADMVQASFSSVDRAFAMNSVLSRALLQFQSFSMNLMASLMTDLPMMAAHEGSGRVIKGILRTYAGASIVNELAEEVGMPQPFNLGTFVPGLTSFRYGMPGVYGIFDKIGAIARGDDTKIKELGRAAATMAVTGGGQAYKIGEALLDDKATPKERVKGAIFGMSTQRKYARKAKEGKKESKKGIIASPKKSKAPFGGLSFETPKPPNFKPRFGR